MNIKNVISFTTCGLVLLAGCQPAEQEIADTVLTNAYVYTVDKSRNVEQALAIKDNTIIFVGYSEDAAAYIADTTDVRDLGGAMVMPGIHDMHVHALGTVKPDMCDLDSQSLSLEQMVPVLQACIEEYDIAPGDWLIVLQWAFSSGNQPSENLPNIRAALDAVSENHPIFLWGDDGHHGAANSVALAMASNEDGEVIGLAPGNSSSRAHHLPDVVHRPFDGNALGRRTVDDDGAARAVCLLEGGDRYDDQVVQALPEDVALRLEDPDNSETPPAHANLLAERVSNREELARDVRADDRGLPAALDIEVRDEAPFFHEVVVYDLVLGRAACDLRVLHDSAVVRNVPARVDVRRHHPHGAKTPHGF